MSNQLVLQSLPQAPTTKGIYALLARLDGKAVWEFLTMPNEILFDEGSSYASANAPGASPFLQFSGVSNEIMTIQNLPLSTIWEKKSLDAYIKALSSLAKPDPVTYSPPALAFRWGQKLFSPCLMGRFSRTETFWTPDGKLTEAKVSFSLTKIDESQLISL